MIYIYTQTSVFLQSYIYIYIAGSSTPIRGFNINIQPDEKPVTMNVMKAYNSAFEVQVGLPFQHINWVLIVEE